MARDWLPDRAEVHSHRVRKATVRESGVFICSWRSEEFTLLLNHGLGRLRPSQESPVVC